MPRKRRRSKARREDFPAQWREWSEWNPLVLGVSDDTDMDRLRIAWFKLREEFLAQHITRHPGTRPWPWWEFERHEPRQIDPSRRRHWRAQHDRVAVARSTDPEKIAQRRASLDRIAIQMKFYLESQTSYLRRLGLLTAEEKQQLSSETTPEEEDSSYL